ncbi:MAG: tRNA uridine-5-carboxymethylaminomethyl(34) synthesis GTPase MnmE [Candidatus Omnitrophota bacterium]
MIKYDINDTIAAVCTPIGEAGIAIVRISGKDALTIADRIFTSKSNKKPSAFKTYTTHYGWIIDQSLKAGFVDEVILTVMRAPKSYTKEDVVEINCHGGIVAMRRVLGLVLENGARIAEPGEFTKRAFLNGRIDLAQAEAVLDIIRAKTDSALRTGAEQLKGVLSNQINQIRVILLDVLSILEADIDFPEEGLDPARNISQKLCQLDYRLKEMLKDSKRGRILREGIHVVVCGRPNVGKSSLLNALLKQERSIVSPIPGTTRDTIEEIIDIRGIPVRIVDTAGIIKPRDLVEKEAVRRSRRYMELADLVILLFDGSRRLSKDDIALARKLKGKPVIAVINKIDLKQKLDKEKILKKFKCVIDISAKRLKNIDLLEDALVKLVYNGKIVCPEPALVSNFRHIEALKEAQRFVAEAAVLNNKLSLEFTAQDIKDALSCIDEILGRRLSGDLLDKIFSKFCIGK